MYACSHECMHVAYLFGCCCCFSLLLLLKVVCLFFFDFIIIIISSSSSSSSTSSSSSSSSVWMGWGYIIFSYLSSRHISVMVQDMTYNPLTDLPRLIFKLPIKQKHSSSIKTFECSLLPTILFCSLF